MAATMETCGGCAKEVEQQLMKVVRKAEGNRQECRRCEDCVKFKAKVYRLRKAGQKVELPSGPDRQ
eukprot:3595778-Karenia_brevis.AAC.1